MKRILLLLVLLVGGYAVTDAQCTRYNGRSEQGGQIVTTVGTGSSTRHPKSYPSSTVTIYQPGTTTLVSLFSDAACSTPKSNPITVGSDSTYFFYANNQATVDIRHSGTGITTPFTIPSVVIITAAGSTPASNYASLAAAVTSIGATPTTLVVSAADFPSGASTTVPSTLILDFRGPGTILLTTGHVVIIQSGGSNWPIKKLFSNALAGQGTVSFTGNTLVAKLDPRWWGAVADGSTNDQTAWAATLEAAKTMKVATVTVPRGTSLVTSLSIPIVAYDGNDGFSLTLEGQSGPPPSEHNTVDGNYQATDDASIIKSTTAGTSGVIDVAAGSFVAVELTLRNLVIRREVSPAGPGIDALFLGGLHLENVAVDTGLKTTDVETEPTTVGATGVIWPGLSNSGAQSIIGSSFVQGYTTCMKAGEHLIQSGGQLTISACGVGIEFPLAAHALYFDLISAQNLPRVLKWTGTAHVVINELNIEHANVAVSPAPAWQETVYDIDDASFNGRGRISWIVIKAADAFSDQPLIRNGGKYIRYSHLRKAYNIVVEATRTATQAITTGGAGQAISWTSLRNNVDSAATVPFTEYTIPTSGVYDIDVHVKFEASATGTFALNLMLNGSTNIAQSIRPNAGTYIVTLSLHRTIVLEQGSTIKVVAFHDFGADRNILVTASDYSPSLTVALR